MASRSLRKGCLLVVFPAVAGKSRHFLTFLLALPKATFFGINSRENRASRRSRIQFLPKSLDWNFPIISGCFRLYSPVLYSGEQESTKLKY